MAVTKAKKAEILKELIDKFSRSKTTVFAGYKGLDVKNLSEMRKQLRAQNAEFMVAKKTLISLAAKENKLPVPQADALQDAVGAAFSYDDELAGIRVLSKLAKTNQKLVLLGAIIDGLWVGKDVVKRYAAIPDRPVLLAKLLGSMQAPLSGFYGVLHGTLAGFVRVVNAYQAKKPAEVGQKAPEAAPPATAPAAPAEVPAQK